MTHKERKDATDNKVMAFIAQHWTKYYCTPTLYEIAEACGIGYPTAHYVKRRLVQKGQLVDTGKSYVPANVYKG